MFRINPRFYFLPFCIFLFLARSVKAQPDSIFQGEWKTLYARLDRDRMDVRKQDSVLQTALSKLPELRAAFGEHALETGYWNLFIVRMYLIMRQAEEALPYMSKAEQIGEQLPESPQRIRFLLNLYHNLVAAHNSSNLKQGQKVLLYAQKMDDLLKQYRPEDVDARISALAQISTAYRMMENFAESEVYQLETEKFLAKKGLKPGSVAEIHLNRGILEGRKKNWAKSIEAYQRGLEVARQNDLKDLEATLLFNIAGMYNSDTDMEQSLTYYEKYYYNRKDANRQIIPEILQSMPWLYCRVQNAPDKAFDLFAEQLGEAYSEVVDKMREPNAEFVRTVSEHTPGNLLMNALIGLTRVQRYLYQKDTQNIAQKKRLYYATDALLSLARVRQTNSLQDEGSLWWENFTLFQALESNIGVALELYQATGDTVFRNKTFDYMEYGKTLLLQRSVQSNKAARFGELPDSLTRKMAAFQKEITLLEGELLAAQQRRDEGQVTKLRDALLRQKNQNDVLLKQIESDYPKYGQMRRSQGGKSLTELQKSLDAGTAVLEYVVSKQSIFALCLSRDSIRFFRLPADSLEEYTAALRKQLGDFSALDPSQDWLPEYKAAAGGFFRRWVQPVLPQNSDIKRLLIVPDGLLAYVPFECLLMDDSGRNFAELNYLLRRYAISYSFSAGIWEDQRPTRSFNHDLVAFGAVYDATAAAPPAANRTAPLLAQRAELAPIPFVVEEVGDLEKRYRGLYFKGLDACERHFKTHAPEGRILHLAMHGLLNKKTPLLSSLAFSENGDSTEDNFLHAYELSALQLDAELAVLSACETGYGKFMKGEGMMSLARSFMYAGVGALVVSLWQVNDHATAGIMNHFYEALYAGKTKDVALQQAKLAYLEQAKGMAAHPALWSAFVHIGNRQPVALSGAKTWIWWSAAGIAVAAAMGWFALSRSRSK